MVLCMFSKSISKRLGRSENVPSRFGNVPSRSGNVWQWILDRFVLAWGRFDMDLEWIWRGWLAASDDDFLAST